MRVQPDQLEALGVAHALDRALGEPVGEPEAELRVLLAGLDVGVGRRLDPGGDPDQHALGTVEQPLRPLDLVEGVQDQVPDAGVERVAQLALGLVVAVQVDAARARSRRRAPCAARRRRRRRPTGPRRAAACRRPCRQGLAGVDHLEVVGALAEGAHVLGRAGRGCRPRRRCRRGCRTPAASSTTSQPAISRCPALVHARARRIDRRGGDRVGRGRDRPLVVGWRCHPERQF